ncbi:MAG: inorganic diphosphatase [Povalibacter sp.]|jgi:inorganic pyrophosphatase
MRNPYESIPTWSHARERVHVVVDTQKGSRNKFRFDEELGAFTLAHVLPLGTHFPYDFGSVPRTLAEDGDPIDVMILSDEPTFVGCVIDVLLIGVIEAEQTSDGETKRNDRLLGVPVTKVNAATLAEISDVPSTALDQIELFFSAYNLAHGRQFKPLHRRGSQAARQLVLNAAKRYEEKT